MKRILIVCAALLLCGVAAARGRGVHRVASCNIRVALPQDEEGGNGWSARKYVCERVMKRCKADIYCLQEVTIGQYEDMCRMFPGYFVFGYPGPETDALPDREYHGIAKNLVMFSKRRYEMTGAGVYWLSDTPLVGGSSSWGTARPRHVNWVRLRDRRSGREFRVLSLHLDHISHEARLAQVRAVEEETSQYPAGVPQVLAELKDLLNTGCKTVDEMTVGELIQVHRAPNGIDRNVIKTAAEPFSVGNGLAVLRGNIAPDGCITKPAAIREDMRTFSGTARVFDSEDDAIRDILGGNIHAGDVLVIRYEGPKGGPGMREMCNAMKYLYGLGLGTSTAIITDGRFSGTNNGCFVGHISPEAAEGGPIAAVRDGDAVTIDIPNRVITLHVSTEEIRERLAHVVKPAPRFTSGYLAMYSKYATSASQGAVLE